MKNITILSLLIPFLIACEDNSGDAKMKEVEGVGVTDQGVLLKPVEVDTAPPENVITHENARFRNVQVRTVGEEQFQITGEAQVFEGTISWTIEDGHNVLEEGHETTSAGAPEWGKFDFTVNAKKERENSTLHIILYESSAKDGSRQHELPVLLY